MDRTNIRKITSKPTKPVFLCLQTKPESMNVTVYRRMDIFVMFSVPSLNSRHLKVCIELKNLIYCWYILVHVEVCFACGVCFPPFIPLNGTSIYIFFYETRKLGILNMVHAVSNIAEFIDLFGELFYGFN